MKKTIVLYRSKTGFSKRYAEWIAEDLACECRPVKGVRLDDLKDYKLVIYGAGIYAGMIAGLGKVKNWIGKSPDKTWVVFATGAAPHEEGYEELVLKTNFRKGESRPAHFYYFLSGIDYERMGFFNRVLMKIFSGMASKKNGTPQPTKQTSVDLANRHYIADLLSYVRLKAR
jgi:menaquinone-dependent protoporphyrinogen IX oxidase